MRRELKVLIVDQDREEAFELAQLCEAARWQPQVALRKCEGIALARLTRPKVVISALVLPDGTALDLARVLHADPETSRMPVVVLSALPERLVIDEARQAGIRTVITKPWLPSEVVDAVRRAARPGNDTTILDLAFSR